MMHGIYASIIAALLAFVVWYTDTIETSGENKCKAEYESTLRQDLIASGAHIERLERENNDLVLDLLNKQPEIRTVYKTINKEVVRYVPENPACNLTRGAVRLRNIAANPDQSMHTGAEYPALSDAEAAEASTISQQAAEQQVYDWAELYNDIEGRYSALIDICANNQKQQEERPE